MKKYIPFLFCFFLANQLFAQSHWPSPEAEQIYTNAQTDLSAGRILKANTQFQTLILMAPQELLAIKGLAQSYFYLGAYENAYQTLSPCFKNKTADEYCYQLAADCKYQSKEYQSANSLLERGITKFPNSGMLYYKLGTYYNFGNAIEDALETWLKGIKIDPTYRLNYYEAARAYAHSTQLIWALIYGEQFINMEQETARTQEMKTLLLKVYNALLLHYAELDNSYKKDYNPFISLIQNSFNNLSGVMSDGLNVENLTMLRTRFTMNWIAKKTTPFSLFNYWNQLLQNGHFEAYNQWLFGEELNKLEFESWKKQNPTAIGIFKKWASTHPLKPSLNEFYNTEHVKNVFPKH